MKSWSFVGGPASIPYRLFDWARTRVNRFLVDYLLACAIVKPGSRVLEAGSGPACGSSVLSRSEKVTLSVALDLDIDALREARRRDPKLPAVVANLYDLPFAAETFDLAWNSSTIEHLDQPELAVAEMRRVTRGDGCIFVGVPYRRGPLGFQRWIAATSAGVWIGSVFGREELSDLVVRLGLRPVDTQSYCFGFFIGLLARRA
jgi:SAM-dependent methyltransferase